MKGRVVADHHEGAELVDFTLLSLSESVQRGLTFFKIPLHTNLSDVNSLPNKSHHVPVFQCAWIEDDEIGLRRIQPSLPDQVKLRQKLFFVGLVLECDVILVESPVVWLFSRPRGSFSAGCHLSCFPGFGISQEGLVISLNEPFFGFDGQDIWHLGPAEQFLALSELRLELDVDPSVKCPLPS